MEWQAQSYRVTLLNQDPFVNESVDWWEKLLNKKPDIITQQPNTFGSKNEGIFESNDLTLDIKPERIDWNYIVKDDVSTGPKKEVSTIGPANDAIKPFNILINKWLKLNDLPKVRRIAFGAKLMIPVSDVVTGYSILNEFLQDINVNYDKPSDFLYQINKKRDSESGITNLRINRLTKWSVMKFRSFLLSPDPSASIKYLDTFACHLELDISTVKLENEIPNDKLDNVYDELVRFGLEIAEKGDIS